FQMKIRTDKAPCHYQTMSLPAFISGRVPMNSRRIERDKSLAALYPQLSAEWCYDKNAGLTPYDILPHSNRKIWWRCKQGHKWQATPCHRQNSALAVRTVPADTPSKARTIWKHYIQISS